MAMDEFLIETGVDRLVKLIRDTKKISLGEAAKRLGVTRPIVSEWAGFLEEEGLLRINYIFTTPYLELRQVTDAAIQKKEAELAKKRQEMEAKIQSAVKNIDAHTEGISKARQGLESFNAEVATELTAAKVILDELREYQSQLEKANLNAKEHGKEYLNSLGDMKSQLEGETEKYSGVLAGLAKDKELLKSEKELADQIKSEESDLMGRLGQIQKRLGAITKKPGQIKDEITARELEELKTLADKIATEIKERNDRLQQVLGEVRKYEVQMRNSEKKIKQFIQKSKSGSSKDARKKKDAVRLKLAMSSRKKAEALIKKAESDISKISTEMETLLKKASALKEVSGSKSAKAHLKDLLAMRGDVARKLNSFIREAQMLGEAVHKL